MATRAVSAARPHIEENSNWMKAVSCVPILGIIPSMIQETSLVTKIAEERRAPKKIELIQIKNHYKIANATRGVLAAALLVIGIASGILNLGFLVASLSVIGLLGFSVWDISQAIHNAKIVDGLRAAGAIPRGMTIA
jgi:hypothetical protein